MLRINRTSHSPSDSKPKMSGSYTGWPNDQDQNQKLNGVGFVLFKTKEATKAALEKSMYKPLKGKIPYVSYFQMKEERQHQKALNRKLAPYKSKMVPSIKSESNENRDKFAPYYPPQEVTLSIPVSQLSFAKDSILTKLKERGFGKRRIKKILSSISNEQAISMYSDLQKLNDWIESLV